MGTWLRKSKRRLAIGLCSVGVLFQFGGCQFNEITVVQTVDGRELLISLIRGAVLGPIDTAITNAINNAFSSDDDE